MVSTTGFGPVCLGSSPGFTTITLYQLNNMSTERNNDKTLNLNELIELIQDGFYEFMQVPTYNRVKTFNRKKHIHHPALVKVKSGDGIGLDCGKFVYVTNARNNVGMLLKANYNEPFEKYEQLEIAKSGVHHTDDLVVGRTYYVQFNGHTIFEKYLGNLMTLMVSGEYGEVITLQHGPIPTHYELSIPAER